MVSTVWVARLWVRFRFFLMQSVLYMGLSRAPLFIYIIVGYTHVYIKKNLSIFIKNNSFLFADTIRASSWGGKWGIAFNALFDEEETRLQCKG